MIDHARNDLLTHLPDSRIVAELAEHQGQRRAERRDFLFPQARPLVEDLFEERGAEEKVWGSMVKQTLKRRRPGFNESYHGFRNFGELLEEAQSRNMLELQFDEKSGGYIIRNYAQD